MGVLKLVTEATPGGDSQHHLANGSAVMTSGEQT